VGLLQSQEIGRNEAGCALSRDGFAPLAFEFFDNSTQGFGSSVAGNPDCGIK